MVGRLPWPRQVLVLLVAGLLLPSCLSCASPSPTAPRRPTTAKPDFVRYVSPNGNDTWPGTKLRPWRTLARSLPALLPDQLLYVRGGTYRENLAKLDLHSGTSAAPITVMAYPGERPVIAGALLLRRPSHWRVDGLAVTSDPDLRPAPRQLVKIIGGVGWRFENNEVYGSRGAANLLVTGFGKGEPADWSITGNCIHDVHPATAPVRVNNLVIGPMRTPGPGTVTRNLIFNQAGDAGISADVAIGTPAGGAQHLGFDYNTVFAAQTTLAFAGGSTDVRVARNILGRPTTGLLVRWGHARSGSNVLTDNLGLHAHRFTRRSAASHLSGSGNITKNQVAFDHVDSCNGFHGVAAFTFPYGRYAVG